MWVKYQENERANARVDVDRPNLAMRYDLNTRQLMGLVDRKLKLMLTKVKTDSKPKNDFMDGN